MNAVPSQRTFDYLRLARGVRLVVIGIVSNNRRYAKPAAEGEVRVRECAREGA